MEIEATVYAIAQSEETLDELCGILSEMTFQHKYLLQRLEPSAVLPLTRTWYAFTMRDEPTNGPEEWMDCLSACGALGKKSALVYVEYRSPDNDIYTEYAYTTPRENAGYSGSAVAVNSYDRALGNRDITLALSELLSDRTAGERAAAARRKEKKETQRLRRGDFEITADGVLKKYRGLDMDVVIPDGVKEIAESAFVDLRGVERMLLEDEEYDAPPMETLSIPGSVEKIGRYAFAYCMELKEVRMANSVKLLGDRAFEGCENLRKIRLSSGLTAIEEYTFFLCESLTSITNPEGVTRIDKGAFSSCDALRKVTLPKTIKSIGDEAFEGTALTNIVIPDSVEEIGKDAFPEGCARQ